MNTYEIKRIKYDKNLSYNEYVNRVKNASIYYCNGISELRFYCGSTLHYSQNAKGYWWGLINGYEYVARKVG